MKKKKKPTSIVRAFQGLFDALYRILIPLGEILYMLRDILVLVIMTFVGKAVAGGLNVYGLYILAFAVFWLCLSVRQIHLEYKRLERKNSSGKRFTFLDDGGNPSIRIEDLPEIVDYLYRLEESNGGIKGTRKE